MWWKIDCGNDEFRGHCTRASLSLFRWTKKNIKPNSEVPQAISDFHRRNTADCRPTKATNKTQIVLFQIQKKKKHCKALHREWMPNVCSCCWWCRQCAQFTVSMATIRVHRVSWQRQWAPHHRQAGPPTITATSIKPNWCWPAMKRFIHRWVRDSN